MRRESDKSKRLDPPEREESKRLDPPEREGRRKYLKTVGTLAVGLAVGGAVGWLIKPAERIGGVTISTGSWQPFYASAVWTAEEGKTDLCKEFEEETGIRTVWETGGEDVMRDKIFLDLSSETGMYDILNEDDLTIPVYAHPGWIEPLEPLAEKGTNPKYFTGLDDWYPKVLESNSYEGKLYGVPIYGSGGGLFYRRDLLEKYGWDKAPATFEELEACCADLADGFQRDGIKDIYPFVLQGKHGEEAAHVSAGTGWAYGGTFFEDNAGTVQEIKEKTAMPVVNSPEFVSGFEMLGNLCQNYSPPGIGGYSWFECFKDMAENRAALCLMNSTAQWLILLWAKDAGVEDPNTVGVVRGPMGPVRRYEMYFCSTYMISNFSKNKEAAWEVIQLLVSKQSMWGLVEDMGVWGQPVKSIMESEEFARIAREPYGIAPTDEDLKEIADSVKLATPEIYPRVPEWKRIQFIIGSAGNEVITGQKTAKQALEDANTEVYDVMKKGGYYG